MQHETVFEEFQRREEEKRNERIAAAIAKRDADVVVERKPEPPIQWMVGTND